MHMHTAVCGQPCTSCMQTGGPGRNVWLHIVVWEPAWAHSSLSVSARNSFQCFFFFWSKCTRNKVLCNIKSTSQKKEGGMEILLSLLEEGTTEDTVWLLPQGYFILGREGNREVWALFLFSRKLSPGRLLSANILVVVKTFKPSVRPEAKSKNNTMELCNKILVICPKCKFLSYYKCVRGFQG